MKKPTLLFWTFIAILAWTGVGLEAQQLINWNQIRGVPIGTIRNNVIPCLKGSSTCGSNPPVYQATVADCGTMIPGNSMYNQVSGPLPNFAPSNGGYLKLPTTAAIAAAGKTQCDIGVVLPAVPTQYLCVDPQGAKFTSFPGGISIDILHGCYMLALFPSAVVNFSWDNTSWIITAGTPNLMCWTGQCQIPSLGQGKLSLAGTDDLVWCPFNGNGVGVNHSAQPTGGVLIMAPANCAHATTGSASLVEYAELEYIGSTIVTAVAAGAANGAGGNYVNITTNAVTALHNGDTVECHNIQMNLGTQTDNQWVIGNMSGNSFDLVKQIQPNGTGGAGYATVPSVFITGDTWVSGGTVATGSCGWLGLVLSSVSTTPITDPVTGVTEDGVGSEQFAIVGVVKVVSTHPTDTNAQRYVASAFNKEIKACKQVYTADRSTSSVTYAQPNAEIQCSFVYFDPPPTPGSHGALPAALNWTLNYKVVNATPTNECDVSVGFDSTTVAETEQAAVPDSTLPASRSLSGSHQYVAGSGNLAHFVTVLMKSPSGTSCTLDHNFTSLVLGIPQ